MKILTVISTLDFSQFTRRATIEAISKKVDLLDILFFTGFKNFYKKRVSVNGIGSFCHHFLIPDTLKQRKILRSIEHGVRAPFWENIFSKYDVLFFTDPNQAYLLPYVQDQKTIYLIRDPNVLQSDKQRKDERDLLSRADLVLATSHNLAHEYIQKYHHIQHPNVRYWPNCADLSIWKASNIQPNGEKAIKIGVAGNFGKKRSDYDLLDYITSNRGQIQFELAGKVDDMESNKKWKHIVNKENVSFLGYVQFEDLPKIVGEWTVGLITEKMNEYASYMHHNKVYQYLALGIPVVTLKIHNDYDNLYPFVQSVPNYEDYLKALDYAIERSNDEEFRKNCITIAHENSSAKRADLFVRWVEQLF